MDRLYGVASNPNAASVAKNIAKGVRTGDTIMNWAQQVAPLTAQGVTAAMQWADA